MRLYYFTPDEHALENLFMQRLKVSFPDEVNDVFEFKPFNFQDADDRRTWSNIIKKRAKKYGFISFSESWESPTMWAHYTNNHRGVCYGFDVDVMCNVTDPQQTYFSKITYTDTMLNYDVSRPEEMGDWANTTKFKHWEYEKEWRVMIGLNDIQIERRKERRLVFKPFAPGVKLHKVIIGRNSSLSSHEIRQATTHYGPDIQVLTARPAFTSFKMVEQLDPSFQK
ncbi:MAG: DUF2971 domain-containing protein [Planktomarina sp.]|uniref:DUF2971 domain-containing protein n=1 Tax=Halocynthiibacter sp. TaxID=1979210 RepID=UPI003C670782